MASAINFYLDKPHSDKDTQIFIFFSFKGKRLKIASGLSIHPKRWNSQSQCIRGTDQEVTEWNATLDKTANDIKEIYRKAMLQGITATPRYIRQELKNKETPPQEQSFTDVFNRYIATSKASKSYHTVKQYTTTLNHLKDFSAKRKTSLEFDQINMSFYEDLVNYLYTDKQQLANSVGSTVKGLKAFMAYAYEIGAHTNFEFKKFKKPGFDTEVLFLTKKELFEIYNLDLSKHKHLAKVRDYFCFACFTGLRYSNIYQLRPEHVAGDELRITHVKTKNINQIPLNPFAQTIIDKYYKSQNERLFPVISNQKANESLKTIGQMAKLNTRINWVNFRGSERVEKTFQKWEKLTFHIAKKTFITNSLMFGMNEKALMDITGNKSHKVFQRYVRITQDFKKSEMNRIWGQGL